MTTFNNLSHLNNLGYKNWILLLMILKNLFHDNIFYNIWCRSISEKCDYFFFARIETILSFLFNKCSFGLFQSLFNNQKRWKKTRESAFVQNCIPVKKININLNPKYLKRKMSQTNVKWPFGAYVKKIDLIWIFFCIALKWICIKMIHMF